MNNNNPPTWFRVVSVIAILWYALGIVAFLVEVPMTGEAFEALPSEQRMLYQSLPAVYIGAFAIAVFVGTAGVIALALRKPAALPMLVVSLVATLIQMIHVFGVAKVYPVAGPTSLIMPALIIAIGAALVWLYMHARKQRWIVSGTAS